MRQGRQARAYIHADTQTHTHHGSTSARRSGIAHAERELYNLLQGRALQGLDDEPFRDGFVGRRVPPPLWFPFGNINTRGCFWVSRAHDFDCGCQPSASFRFLRALVAGSRPVVVKARSFRVYVGMGGPLSGRVQQACLPNTGRHTHLGWKSMSAIRPRQRACDTASGSGECARTRAPIVSGWRSSAAPAFRAFGGWRARVEGIWAVARGAATNH